MLRQVFTLHLANTMAIVKIKAKAGIYNDN